MSSAQITKPMLMEFWTFIKYALTGVFNTTLTYAIFSILVYIHIQPSMALAIGYIFGMVSSYAINSQWTFRQSRNLWSYFGHFLVINLLVLAISEVTLHELLHYIHTPYIAQLVNVIPMTIIGYLSNRYLVFVPKIKPIIKSSQNHPPQLQVLAGFSKDLFVFAAATAITQRLWLTLYTLAVLFIHKQKISWYNLFLTYYRHWDSGWYLEIAQHGFLNLKETAFWPLYPIFMYTVHEVARISLLTSGVLVSFVAFIFFLYYLGRITTIEFGPTIARTAILLFAFFPTSYYFDAIYTESLFMVLCVAAIDRAMANKFWVAGFLAGLATLTRNTGVFLDLILLFEYLHHRNMDLRFWTRSWWRYLDVQIFALTLPAVMLALYMIYLKVRTGHLLAFLTAEKYWNRHYMPLWDTYYFTWLRMLHSSGWTHEYFLIELTMITLAIFMAIIGMQYIRRSYRLFSWWLYMIVVLWIAATEPSLDVKDYLVSFPRYILMLFPGFIFLSVAVHSVRATPLLLLLFALGLGILGHLFFHGVWIA